MKSALSLSILLSSVMCVSAASAQAAAVNHSNQYTAIAGIRWQEDCVDYQISISSTKRDEESVNWTDPAWEEDVGTIAYRIQNNCDPERVWSHSIQAVVPYSTTMANDLSKGSFEVDVDNAFSNWCGFEADGVRRCRKTTAPMTVSVHFEASTPLHIDNSTQRTPLDGGGMSVIHTFFRARLQNATVVGTAGDYIVDATASGTMYNKRETEIRTGH